jgi:hypothetical protein
MKISFLLALIVFLSPLNSALAQTKPQSYVKAHVPVTGIGEPASAIGLLISRKGSEQVLKTSTSVDAHGNVVVSFPYPKSLAQSGGTASAMVVDTEGNYALGQVIALRPRGATSPISTLPACEPPKRTHSITAQYALLESLVEIRGRRRTLMQDKIREILEGDLAGRLRKIEQGFGLQTDTVLNAEMNPAELIDRLARILHSMESFQANKRKQMLDRAIKEASQTEATESGTEPDSADAHVAATQ